MFNPGYVSSMFLLFKYITLFLYHKQWPHDKSGNLLKAPPKENLQPSCQMRIELNKTVQCYIYLSSTVSTGSTLLLYVNIYFSFHEIAVLQQPVLIFY